MRAGKLCQSCHKKCDPDEMDNTFVDCPVCDGKGCSNCDDVGSFKIPGCPNEYVRSLTPIIRAIDYFHEGMPPINGGLLDQSASFVEAARILKNEDIRIKNNG